MLNTENLRGGATVRRIGDVSDIQSPLVQELTHILRSGTAAGVFRRGIDPVDLYITIASLCYFPISNAHTLRAVFGCPIDDAWLSRREQDVAELVIRFLRPGTGSVAAGQRQKGNKPKNRLSRTRQEKE